LATRTVAAAPAKLWQWQGTVFGADASITLAAANRDAAEETIAAARAEIERLEQIFSLFRATSALSRLNAEGRLDTPPADLVALLSLSREIHAATDGVFDPAIQPRWLELAQASATGDEAPPAGTAGRFSDVHIDGGSVAFAKPSMALTLNGIAQGYATDKVAHLFSQRGLTDILVDLGEYRALGRHPDGRPWRVALGSAGGSPVDLDSTALATSEPCGTTLDAAGRLPQMINPATGMPAAIWRRVSVAGPRAAVADALSTAFSIMPADAIASTLATLPSYRPYLTGFDGSDRTIG
jgi:thiamine biosynthesis lipoprotein